MSDARRQLRRDPRREGSVLIVAMVVLFALAAMTLAMGHTARVDAYASANVAADAEARAVARGAEQYVIHLALTEQAASLNRPETDFMARPIGRGWFWLLRPAYTDSPEPRCGITDESLKINLNNASFETLRQVSGMTDEMASAIVDWRDPDDEPSGTGGAESPYYGSLPQPYNAKNGPFESVEELLLVRGVTPQWLFGQSYVRRHTPDAPPAEMSGSIFDEAEVELGTFDRFTVYGGGQTYSAEIVALSGDGRAFRRVRIAVRVDDNLPRVVHRRDITHRGWPLDPTIIASVRRGEGLPPVATDASAIRGGVL